MALVAASCAARAGEQRGGDLDLGPQNDVHTVRVDVPAGTVHIEAGESLSGHHSLTGLGADQALQATLSPSGELSITGACRRLLPCEATITLQVPPHTRVIATLQSGEVTTLGVDDVDVGLGRGEVAVHGARTLATRVGSGSLLAVMQAGARVRAVVARGDATVHVPSGAWKVDTAARQLTLSGVGVDPRAPGELMVHAPDGNVVLKGDDDLARR